MANKFFRIRLLNATKNLYVLMLSADETGKRIQLPFDKVYAKGRRLRKEGWVPVGATTYMILGIC